MNFLEIFCVFNELVDSLSNNPFIDFVDILRLLICGAANEVDKELENLGYNRHDAVPHEDQQLQQPQQQQQLNAPTGYVAPPPDAISPYALRDLLPPISTNVRKIPNL